MRISVITVVYNDVCGIEKTIKSVIEQDYYDVEYIIIDGNSRDGTIDIIRMYEDRITRWLSEPDNGIYDAMNKGIRLSTGDYLSFINSGDWYEKGALSIIANYIERDNSDIVYGKVNKIVDDKIVGYMGTSSEMDTDLKELHLKNVFCHQGMFIRKKTFMEVGLYNVSYKALADYDWNLRAYNRGKTFQMIKECVANYLDGGFSSYYDSGKEYYEIAMNGLNGYNDFIPLIQKKAKYYSLRVLVFKILEDKKDCLYKLFSANKKYCIWGVGQDGLIVLEILAKLKIQILAFIDKAPNAVMFRGIPVIKSTDKKAQDILCKNDIMIVISSTNYEREIRNDIHEYGVHEDRILSLRDIFEYIDCNEIPF